MSRGMKSSSGSSRWPMQSSGPSRQKTSACFLVLSSQVQGLTMLRSLLLDALGIVVHTQPTLLGILQRMDPESLVAPGESYPHRGPYAPAPPPSDYISDVPPLPPLNGHGHGHSSHRTNGRSRSSREYRDQPLPLNDDSADHDMIDVRLFAFFSQR